MVKLSWWTSGSSAGKTKKTQLLFSTPMIPREILKKIRQREIRTNRIVTETLMGLVLCLFSISLNSADAAEYRDMVFEGLNGDVTTNEYQSFIHKLAVQRPPPASNIGNLMVDERDGTRLHGMQTFYEFTHDRRALDMAIVWSDAFLHARNDPTNGRIVWTGGRDLCWPNKDSNDVQVLHAGAENGDVIERIVNTARLILENPSVSNETVPPDKFGFGTTYL